MPNFEFSDTSTFASDDTLSINDFKRGGGSRQVSSMWKMMTWILVGVVVVESVGLGWWIRKLKKDNKDVVKESDVKTKLKNDDNMKELVKMTSNGGSDADKKTEKDANDKIIDALKLT